MTLEFRSERIKIDLSSYYFQVFHIIQTKQSFSITPTWYISIKSNSGTKNQATLIIRQHKHTFDGDRIHASAILVYTSPWTAEAEVGLHSKMASKEHVKSLPKEIKELLNKYPVLEHIKDSNKVSLVYTWQIW